MKLPRREFLHLSAAASAVAVIPRLAIADSYPSRPVRLIVGFPAGYATDIVARLVAQSLSERLGQQVFVENHPGAATNIAAEEVVKAVPDGYTLLAMTVTNAVNATLYNNLKFNIAHDVAPIVATFRSPNVLVVTPSLPAKTLPEFIAYAKANPGKINYASAGYGSAPNVNAECTSLTVEVSCLICLAVRFNVLFHPYLLRSRTYELASSVPSRSPARRVQMRCRTFQLSQNLCQGSKHPFGTELVHQRKHQKRLSIRSTIK